MVVSVTTIVPVREYLRVHVHDQHVSATQIAGIVTLPHATAPPRTDLHR